MQPQGHAQVLLNMLEFGMQPQEALDRARICIEDSDRLISRTPICLLRTIHPFRIQSLNHHHHTPPLLTKTIE